MYSHYAFCSWKIVCCQQGEYTTQSLCKHHNMSLLYLFSLIIYDFGFEGFDSSVIMPFSWCVVAVTLPI